MRFRLFCVVSFTLIVLPCMLLGQHEHDANFFTKENHNGDKIELLYNGIRSHSSMVEEDKQLIKRHLFTTLIKYKSFMEMQWETINDSVVSGYVEEYVQYFSQNKTQILSQYSYSSNKSQLLRGGLGGGVEVQGVNEPCTNVDFETCDLSGWELYEAEKDDVAPYSYTNVTLLNQIDIQHFVVTTADGDDPITGLPKAYPYSGNCSVMMGDETGTGNMVSILKQTFKVDANSTAFSYNYMLVLENPAGHTASEQPFFQVKMFDELGNPIFCAMYEVVSGPGGDPDFIPFPNAFSPDGYYLPWRTTFVPLDDYIGQNVTVEFILADCSQGGHYGYGYIESSCKPLQVEAKSTVICNNEPITIHAPPGAASYLWNTGETTQSIEVVTPGNYSVAVTPVVGGVQCQVVMDVDVTTDPTDISANFTVGSTCIGSPIQLTDASTIVGARPIISWEWDFNNDSKVDNAIEASPIIPNVDGDSTLDISLWVSDGVCASNIIIPVTLSGVIAGFEPSVVCEDTPTMFYDTSQSFVSSIVDWSWDFDSDGSEDANGTQVNQQLVAGNHNVVLTVTTSDGCVDQVSKVVTTNPLPLSDFTIVTRCTEIDVVDQSTISSGSIIDYQWDMGDGTPIIYSSFPITYEYDSPGPYNITLTTLSNLNCIATLTKPINLDPSIDANFILQDACDNEEVSIQDNSVAYGTNLTYSYDVNNDNMEDYNTADVLHNFTTPGVHTISLAISNQNGCKDDTTISVIIHPSPDTDFHVQDGCIYTDFSFNDASSISSGAIVSWNWDLGDGVLSVSQDTVYTYQEEKIYPVTLSVTSDNGCEVEVKKDISVFPLPIVGFTAMDVCLNDSTIFSNNCDVTSNYTSNSLASFNWRFGDGEVGSVASPVHIYDTLGTYEVVLVAMTNNGCVDSAKQEVKVFPIPEIVFGSTDLKGCTPWCVNFYDTSTIAYGTIDEYLWDFGGEALSVNKDPVYCFLNQSEVNPKSFDIKLRMTSDLGCVTDSTVRNHVVSYPIPFADYIFTSSVDDHNNKDVRFEDLSVIPSVWNWDFGDGDFSSKEHPYHIYSDSGTYKVVLAIENQYGCKDTTWRLIRVDPNYDIHIPNTFTPDADGINDYFFANGYGVVKQEMIILDRWGELIYKADGIVPAWDGRYKGELVQVDVYIYKIRVLDIFETWHSYIGKVSVVR